jgi:uncharacterized membrane protein YqhA
MDAYDVVILIGLILFVIIVGYYNILIPYIDRKLAEEDRRLGRAPRPVRPVRRLRWGPPRL